MVQRQATSSSHPLTQRRDQLLEELRILAPDLVEKLELTLDELKRREQKGFDRQR